MEEMILELVAKFPWLSIALGILGTVLVIATLVVGITNTKKDDKVLKKIQEMPIVGSLFLILSKFSLISLKK